MVSPLYITSIAMPFVLRLQQLQFEQPGLMFRVMRDAFSIRKELP
jgi:hypothetical protein